MVLWGDTHKHNIMYEKVQWEYSKVREVGDLGLLGDVMQGQMRWPLWKDAFVTKTRPAQMCNL